MTAAAQAPPPLPAAAAAAAAAAAVQRSEEDILDGRQAYTSWKLVKSIQKDPVVLHPLATTCAADPGPR